MKPFSFFLALILLFTACHKKAVTETTGTPVTKQVTFSVFAVRNYTDNSSSPYGYKSASVKLTIQKMGDLTSGVQPVWDTTFVDRPLAQFPKQPQQHKVQKAVSVLESKEELQVTYEVVYISSFDAPQRFGNSTVLAKGQNSLSMNVEL